MPVLLTNQMTGIFNSLKGIAFFLLQTWLGISDTNSEGTYVWTDGTQTDFTDWGDNQPDNYANVENCIHIRDDTKWNDIRCDRKMNFICKFTPECIEIQEHEEGGRGRLGLIVGWQRAKLINGRGRKLMNFI